jgi:hypothetical protein
MVEAQTPFKLIGFKINFQTNFIKYRRAVTQLCYSLHTLCDQTKK